MSNHKFTQIFYDGLGLQDWWRTTPVATKAWDHGAGGADTHARPAPTTGEDEGCWVLLHCLRTSSRPIRAHVRGSTVFTCCELYRLARVLAGPHLSLSPLFCGPFIISIMVGFRVMGLKWVGPFPLSAHLRLCKRGRDPLPPPWNPSRHWKNERSELPLKWLLKENRGRRPTATSAAAAVVRPHATTVSSADAAASPCLDPAYATADTAAASPMPPLPPYVPPPPYMSPLHATSSPIPALHLPLLSINLFPLLPDSRISLNPQTLFLLPNPDAHPTPTISLSIAPSSLSCRPATFSPHEFLLTSSRILPGAPNLSPSSLRISSPSLADSTPTPVLPPPPPPQPIIPVDHYLSPCRIPLPHPTILTPFAFHPLPIDRPNLGSRPHLCFSSPCRKFISSPNGIQAIAHLGT